MEGDEGRMEDKDRRLAKREGIVEPACRPFTGQLGISWPQVRLAVGRGPAKVEKASRMQNGIANQLRRRSMSCSTRHKTHAASCLCLAAHRMWSICERCLCRMKFKQARCSRS